MGGPDKDQTEQQIQWDYDVVTNRMSNQSRWTRGTKFLSNNRPKFFRSRTQRKQNKASMCSFKYSLRESLVGNKEFAKLTYIKYYEWVLSIDSLSQAMFLWFSVCLWLSIPWNVKARNLSQLEETIIRCAVCGSNTVSVQTRPRRDGDSKNSWCARYRPISTFSCPFPRA